ncbi:MAG: type II toxin-antitoxin system RelE/ParE family toxin [Burkholderiales bacterium]|nr:type II toxin-antitoxin system RelE/ParE family toxin [Burkholderiales bacterium]
MLVAWRPEARAALRAILSHIAERNPAAAFNLFEEIERSASALPQHPYLYRHGRVAVTREIVVHPNYVVVTRVTADSIGIVSVLHSRQQYP